MKLTLSKDLVPMRRRAAYVATRRALDTVAQAAYFHQRKQQLAALYLQTGQSSALLDAEAQERGITVAEFVQMIAAKKAMADATQDAAELARQKLLLDVEAATTEPQIVACLRAAGWTEAEIKEVTV